MRITINVLTNRRLRQELTVQKNANTVLHRKLKEQRDRANQLQVTRKTLRSRVGQLRRELRDAEMERKRYAFDVLHDRKMQEALFEEFSVLNAPNILVGTEVDTE